MPTKKLALAKKNTRKKTKAKNSSDQNNLASNQYLENLLLTAEKELQILQPKIDRLEKQQASLLQLKSEKQRLIALSLSIKSILDNFNVNNKLDLLQMQELKLEKNTRHDFNTQKTGQTKIITPLMPKGIFIPENAFKEAGLLLRRKNTLNYQLFQAIVLNGGQATTEAIKAHLLENHICQPGSGDSFETVALTDISSRINYLVRKNIVRPIGRGVFESCFGWQME
jgi:hypothetical protein